jgi:Leucine-rich repeat (LRR) protein
VLKLKRNKINDAGAEAIFDALAKNKSVKTLHLSDNHITDKIFDKI